MVRSLLDFRMRNRTTCRKRSTSETQAGKSADHLRFHHIHHDGSRFADAWRPRRLRRDHGCAQKFSTETCCLAQADSCQRRSRQRRLNSSLFLFWVPKYRVTKFCLTVRQAAAVAAAVAAAAAADFGSVAVASGAALPIIVPESSPQAAAAVAGSAL